MSESNGSRVHRSNHQRAQVERSERRELCGVEVRVQVVRRSAISSNSTRPAAERAAFSTAVFQLRSDAFNAARGTNADADFRRWRSGA
jgi:hypothetical protein